MKVKFTKYKLGLSRKTYHFTEGKVYDANLIYEEIPGLPDGAVYSILDDVNNELGFYVYKDHTLNYKNYFIDIVEHRDEQINRILTK